MKDYVIYPNGDECPVYPKDADGLFSVAELQDIVGGYIGIEDVGNNVCVVFDDEGDLQDRSYNRRATELIRSVNPEWRRIVAGPVVVCRSGIKV